MVKNERNYLLSSKNPTEYINRSLEVEITSGQKSKITIEWLQKTGYTNDDIKFARHRNPYWKSRKMMGSVERNKKRIIEYNYNTGNRVRWTFTRLQKFLELTKVKKDRELAKIFKTTIPSVQYLRRKLNMTIKILQNKSLTPTIKRIVDYMILDENKLRGML